MAIDQREILPQPSEVLPMVELTGDPAKEAIQAERLRREAIESDQQFYTQGVSDYIHHRRDTPAAQYYIDYWTGRP